MSVRAALVLSALVACAPRASSDSEDVVVDVVAVHEQPEKVDADAPDASVVDSAPAVLFLQPAHAYSGFDGVRAFKVPISVHGAASDLVLAADDPNAATITSASLVDPTGDEGVYFLIEPKRAGLITLTARSRGATGKAEIKVAAYAPARWVAGAQRYSASGNGEPACKQCHEDGRGIERSPAAIASITDGEVGRIITVGGNAEHAWKATDAEREGLITYLRGLAPRGFRGSGTIAP